ncbi:unnamed protein product [Hermetia illucens]|uniref:Uncharacterized protein n=1 Tax=Hermetia illucens TaxID=343691 RepID=A0A7R8URM9_HERIL|nr:uncharacterized protein LOC119651024 isoform X3 [Hermetia illucens]CAD7085752.1 unnamed protein product [Hermetia illucens]
MEVAIGSNGSPPFQREVREWQRVDPNTGALLTGRLEADRWITGPQNAYGKVVDSQNVSQPNGIQHTQRKQLEVLQARTSSGSLQVVRAQTQTVQMSSSRWSSSSLSGGTKTTQSLAGQRFSIPLHMITNGGNHAMTNGNHESHHVSHNSNGSNHQFITEPSLKLSSLMKNSVASSSSSSRSSPRSPTMFGSSVSQRHHHDVTQPTTVRSTDRVGGSSYEAHSHKPHDLDLRHSEKDTLDKDRLQHLHRGRSISNDDLASSDHWDHHGEQVNGDDSSDWRRVSKIRRSFQSPKSSSPPKSSRPLDLPENSVSVSRIRQELENCRRLSTAMRNNHVDLVALDSILNGDDGSATPETDPKSKKNTFLTAESLKEIRGKLKKLSDESLYKEDFITQNDPEKSKTYDECQEEFTVAKPAVMQDAKIVHQPTLQIRSKADTSHNTNSLENRTRHRDTTSSEWYLRRKSYGFEKMVPPSTSMFRQESSTDSGIGRSGELASWSPTENTPRGTVITFGNGGSSSPKTSVTLMNPGPVKRYKEIFDPQNESMEIKRHSIAVDESKYVRDNLRNGFDAKTSINLNGFYSREIDSTQSTVFDDNGKRQKRVEFCKTEVHFAAESGRVNIVETDGKPPPTNNFRRRRRSSGGPISNAYLEAINSGKPIIHFGDNCKTQYEQTPQNTLVEESNNVTVITNGTPDVIIPCTVQEEEAESLSDEISIRGILKNKPVKPKPYHLGENIESSESLWGVRLRPVSAEFSGTKIEDTPGDKHEITSDNTSSVAERVRIVEERKDGAGYSTKINLSLSNSPRSWEAPDLRSHSSDLSVSFNPHFQDRRKSTHFENLSDSLKSTSLIMRTIRSQSCYDESSFRLHIPHLQNQPVSSEIFNTNEKYIGISSNLCPSSRLVPKSNSISKSNSMNSISFGDTKTRIPGFTRDFLNNKDHFTEDDVSSHSSKTVSSSSFSSTSSASFQYERAVKCDQVEVTHADNEFLKGDSSEFSNRERKPVAAPRIKVIGSSNAVSHQLSQLRRMYDAAEADSDDDSSAKADEEVKLYLGYSSTASSMEEKTTELSGSWSRIKAKRASVKQQIKSDLKELPKSNVMTIELHSPTVTMQRNSREISKPTFHEIPTPQPRQSVKTAEIKQRILEETQVDTESLLRNKFQNEPAKDDTPLKIETGGTRKLRDHELLYFGVKLSNPNERVRKTNTSTSSDKYKKANEQLIEITKTKTITAEGTNGQKWKLSSDTPDLLRHSPATTSDAEKEIESIPEKSEIAKETNNRLKQGPVYENLQKPSSYNRRRDLERDEMILKEMNKEAEQALQAISTDKSSRDHHRRNSQRSSKPLETIDEKRSSKHVQKEAKSTPNHNSEIQRRRSCCSNRSSSISSTESLSRLSGSFRSKAAQNNEYVNMQPSNKKRTSVNNKDCPSKTQHRSSSRENHRTTASSSEDLHNGGNVHGHSSDETLRRSRRMKPTSSSRDKERDRIVVKIDENQRITRSTVKTTEDRTKSHKGSGDSTVKGGSLRSSKGEKTDKTGTTKSKVSSTRSSNDSHKMSRSKPTSAVVPSSTSSSSKRSSRHHTRK